MIELIVGVDRVNKPAIRNPWGRVIHRDDPQMFYKSFERYEKRKRQEIRTSYYPFNILTEELLSD